MNLVYSITAQSEIGKFPQGCTMAGRFAYNGKERDDKDGVVEYDYQERIYDPRLGRFKSTDPLLAVFPWNSPYAFAENDVIRSIDLDGLEKVIYTFAYTKGEWTVTKLDLPKPGPLGNGALVKFGSKFFYGEKAKDLTDFIKFYEGSQRDKNGNHVGYILKGESWVTIGYGHAAQSDADKAKYKEGETITEKEATDLLASDIKARKINIEGLDEFENAALTDYGFNTTDKASKAVAKYKKANEQDGQYFLRRSAGSEGKQKRRAGEYILFESKEYYKLDYNRSTKTQNKFKEIYDRLTSSPSSESTSTSTEKKN